MIQEKNYYIIKVETKSGCYYKIGEGYKISRPNKLVEKYNKLRANKAELLTFETLPHNSRKRLNDKTIHAKINPIKMKKADPIYVEHYLGETDGKEEFFELVDKSLDVVDYIKSIVNSCKNKDYTANVKEIVDLDFKDKYHLVNDSLIIKIEEKFPEVDDILFNLQANNVLLIGQFEPDFVASFAMHNNVIIWHDTVEQRHTFTYSKLNNNIKYFEGTLEEFIEEVKDMHIDLIIANPPYGKVGANVTKEIIDNVDFNEYINLLPANDYKRNDSKDLYNYQSDMEPITDGFADAAVTTHLAKIHKNKVNNITLDEFEISNYIDKSLTKYFTENRLRKHYAIDAGITWLIFADNDNIKTTVLIDHRCIPHKHLAYSKNTDEYRWNKLENISIETMKAENKSASTPGKMNKYVIKVNTDLEKINIVNFIYSKDGFRFLSKLFTSMNSDSTLDLNKFFPKVDWTRPWTVEEILKDYGYTEDEIKEVMTDLDNFKGMDD